MIESILAVYCFGAVRGVRNALNYTLRYGKNTVITSGFDVG